MDLKSIQISKSLLNKLIIFLSTIENTSNSKLNHNQSILFNNYEIQKNDFFTIHYQTESDNEKFNLQHSIDELQKENITLKKSLSELNSFFEDTIKENNSLRIELEKELKEKENKNITIISYEKEIESLNEVVNQLKEENEKNLKCIEKNKRLYSLSNLISSSENEEEKNENNDNTINRNTQNNLEHEHTNKFSHIINNKKILKNILLFMDIDNIILFKNTSKSIKTIFDFSFGFKLLLSSFKIYIQNKSYMRKEYINKLLSNELSESQSQILSDGIKKDNSDIERLFKTYLRDKKVPGKHLKDQILICLNFLERDVKINLDMESCLKGVPFVPVNNVKDKESKQVNTTGTGIKNMFKSLLSSNQLNQNNINSNILIGNDNISKSNIYDNTIENEYLLNHLQQLNIKFEYKSKEDIINLINKIYITNFTGDFIKEFNSELVKNFSSILFYSNEAINDIKEIDYLKDLINKRFEKYYKLNKELEEEVESLRSYNKTNKDIKEILLNQKNELEMKYSSFKGELILQQQEIVKKQKEIQMIESEMMKKKKENDFLKNKLVSEYNRFKSEMESIKIEKMEILNSIFDIRKFILRLNISDDGDVVMVNL